MIPKFRVWDKARNEMIVPKKEDYAGYFVLSQVGSVWCNDGVCLDDWCFDFIVMMFSGMKDSNKNEIYEGDILTLINDNGEKITVQCEYGIIRRKMGTGFECDIPSFHFLHADGFKSFPIAKNYAGKHDLELMEIVGNIYATPKLKV